MVILAIMQNIIGSFADGQQAIERMLLLSNSTQLSQIFAILDSCAEYTNTVKLIFTDIKSSSIRARILEHVADCSDDTDPQIKILSGKPTSCLLLPLLLLLLLFLSRANQT